MYQSIFHQFGFKPKKKLGQHFLIDYGVLERILATAKLSHRDIIVEVGPGLGILTQELAKQAAKVIAIELDSSLVAILKKKLSHFPNIKIIHTDILKITPEQLMEDNLNISSEAVQDYKVIANLPYYITSPVLRHFLEASLKPSMMVVMVQKEVGESIVAAPGKMSLLSVRTQFYSKPTIVSYVPAQSFYPSPKVDSVILRLDIYPEPHIEVSDTASFFDIVIDGFSAPRKQLRNSLAQALAIQPGQVALLLKKAGIEARRRAETLSLEEWLELWKIFAPLKVS